MFDPHYASIHEKLIEWAAQYFGEGMTDVHQIVSTEHSYVLKIKAKNYDYYLKRVPSPFFIEAILSQHLNQKCNLRCVPKVLAHNTMLSCFITQSVGQETLRQRFDGRFDQALMLKGVELYKSIQRVSLDHLKEYLALGASDWRFNKFPLLYNALLNDERCMSAWNIKIDQQAYLKQKIPIVEKLCEKINALQIPDALNHSDFHDNNIVVNETSGNLYIIDWSEINISHPLLSLSCCLFGLNDRYAFDTSQYEALQLSFYDGWGISSQAFEENHAIVNVLGQIYYVLTLQDFMKRTGYDAVGLKIRAQRALRVFNEEINDVCV